MTGMTPHDIAAIVVLYRPDAAVIDNVRATAAQVERVFAIDNTEQPDDALAWALRTVPDLSYVALGDNLGIAAALNAGVERARDAGYSWVLTMDQDSTPDEDMVAVLSRCVVSCQKDVRIGIMSPVQVQEGSGEPEKRHGCISVLTAITSGDLLSIEAWDNVGRFDEGLFIDQVDHDICLRMRRDGWDVLRCSGTRLLHRLGDTVQHRFIHAFNVSNHSALRRYYITRNRFEVSRRFQQDFPEFRRREMRSLRRELVKIVFYERHKAAKLLMSWRGYLDYRRGVTGPYKR